jgi:hypothetical protein
MSATKSCQPKLYEPGANLIICCRALVHWRICNVLKRLAHFKSCKEDCERPLGAVLFEAVKSTRAVNFWCRFVKGSELFPPLSRIEAATNLHPATLESEREMNIAKGLCAGNWKRAYVFSTLRSPRKRAHIFVQQRLHSPSVCSEKMNQ